MTPNLILASASLVRARLLENAGLSFECIPAHVDEAEIKKSLAVEGASARQIAEVLAEQKAVKVSNKHNEALVIGADQVLECEGKLFDKPITMDEVSQHLRLLRSKTHSLATATVVCLGGKVIWRHLEAPELTMRPLSDGFIDQYKERNGDKLMSSVGAYFLEEEGTQLFSQVKGDFFAVLGLPMLPLLDLLRRYDVVGT